MNDALNELPTWALAFGASSSLALAAFLRGSLSWDGAFAACLVGGTIWMGLGGEGFIVLCVFFLTSTLLGRVGKSRKARFETHYAKGHRRDALQVMANGGVAFGCAGLSWFQQHAVSASSAASLAEPWALAACASLASANADTWATELGVLSRGKPWHLVTWRRVPAGTSGAVSLLGCGVSGLGAATIALTAWGTSGGLVWGDAFTITLAGFAGSLLDSLLGAIAQRQYVCGVCHAQVETPSHCSAPAEALGPCWARLNNDGVNFLANGLAGAVTWLVVQ